MLVVLLLRFVMSLSTRKWTDEDIIEDVQFLRDELTANFDSLTYARPFSTLLRIANGNVETTMSILPNCHLATFRGHPCMNQSLSGKKMPRSFAMGTMHSSSEFIHWIFGVILSHIF